MNDAREMSGNRPLKSFIARIWLERGPNGDPMWRGHVRHVQGKEETYFHNLQGMSNFLEQVSGVSGPWRTDVSGERDGDPAPGAGKTGNSD